MSTRSFIDRLRAAAGCYTIVLPSFLLILTFIYLPVVWAFVKSLYEFEIGGETRFVGLENYAEYLRADPTTWPSVLNMVLLTAFLVVVKLTCPLVIAKLIHSLPSEGPRYFYRTLFLLPIVVPGIAIQLLWAQMIYSDHGLLNEALKLFGLVRWNHSWLSEAKTALVAVMFVGFPFVGGFEVLIFYAGLSAIPESVNEAAALEGCTGLRKFLYLDIPLIANQLKLILILTIIGGFQGFEWIFALTRGGPGFTTMVPGLWMYFNAFSFQRMGYACAIGVLLFVAILGVTLLNVRYFRSAEQLEGGDS